MTGNSADEIDRLRAALETVADIAEGSETINSLPHIARLARAALIENLAAATEADAVDITERLERAATNAKFYNARKLYLDAKAEIERLRATYGD